MVPIFMSGSSVPRAPFVAFPVLTLFSAAAAVAAGRRGRVDDGRVDYLEYLGRLRTELAEVAAAQRVSLSWHHPEPDTLWTLIGGPRMWERRPSDPDFCLVRVGVEPHPLAARLVTAERASQGTADPVTTTALRRFLDAHSTVVGAPATVGLRDAGTVTIDGDPGAARALLRAMICQLAVLHSPDQLLIAGAIGERCRGEWDWLKWLPHSQHPAYADALGPARMVYRTAADLRRALDAARPPHAVIVADSDETVRLDEIPGATVLAIGDRREGGGVTLRWADESRPLAEPDRMTRVDALVCARRLAPYRAGPGAARGAADMVGFDPISLWRNQQRRERLRVPIGTTVDGATLDLDIKEAAEDGIGPHGLCVGATGSGKSELLRTIALGMAARNSPEALNLLLVDFKGGATFLDLARAPHVAAVVTNLSDEAPLVARMRDALAGEMERRQRLLRTARCAGIAAYERTRSADGRLDPLPTLLIIVDEFSELLSQHPDFADTFVAIGRLGRSLGMHLLLASQRVDEGRLRGLEAHLSYRICLKTLSAAESRAVLGTLDAYHLPNAPGQGFLRAGSGEPIRFRAQYVSGPAPAETPAPTVARPSVRIFSSRAAGRVTRAAEPSATRTVLQAVLDRLAGHGPPAHRVWLPPLKAAPALDALLCDAAPAPGPLTVPIGIVDRPFEQRRTPLTVDLSGAAGNVAVVGAPQSGKSTALCTLVTALAATHDARRLQFYCLDFGGGALASVRGMPHVGAVAGRTEPELVRRMIAELQALVRSRDAARRDEPWDRHVFLVVDGWASLCGEFEALETSVTTVAAQGLSYGVHVILSASRWAEIRPALRDQISTRIELRLGDPADSEIDRKRAGQVPRDRPGHGLSADGMHMVIARPGDGVADGESVAPPIPLLPARVDLERVASRAEADERARVLLGVEEQRLRPVAIYFDRHPHLLVLGDNECGKTATLRTVCRELVRTKTAAQARLLIVDYRRCMLGLVESEHLDGYAMSPAALADVLPRLLDGLGRRMPPPDVSQAQLRARSWWSGPHVYLVVDDYDPVAGPAGNPLLPVAEYLPYAQDLGLHLVVARRSGGTGSAMFEPLLAALRDHACMTLRMSGAADDGGWGVGRPARFPPGRGVLTTRPGDEQVVQVAWSPPP